MSTKTNLHEVIDTTSMTDIRVRFTGTKAECEEYVADRGMVGLKVQKRENPFELKSCYDCSFLESYLSWWCSNNKAKEARGTSMAGCIHCPFWEPDWKFIDKKYKTEEYGHKPIIKKGWWKIWK